MPPPLFNLGSPSSVTEDKNLSSTVIHWLPFFKCFQLRGIQSFFASEKPNYCICQAYNKNTENSRHNYVAYLPPNQYFCWMWIWVFYLCNIKVKKKKKKRKESIVNFNDDNRISHQRARKHFLLKTAFFFCFCNSGPYLSRSRHNHLIPWVSTDCYSLDSFFFWGFWLFFFGFVSLAVSFHQNKRYFMMKTEVYENI